MSHYILTAAHIKKEYNGNTVLRDVSIHIKKGEIYGLVGKNGSGKTTLFRILTGLIQRYNGTVSVGEADVQKSKVSAVINSPSLFLNLSAFENMKAQAFLLGMRDDSRIKQTLKTVGLEDCKNKLVRNFSQGMKTVMTNIWKSDLYRIVKNKLFYGITAFTCIIALLLIMLMRQDIRLGISVFGDLTAFKKIDGIIRIGIAYQKGLGILVAVLISVFIGQEYQWQTWQQKWLTSKNRIFIYLSKAALSSAVSAAIFLIFQIVALLSSGQIQEMLTPEYTGMMISGVFIYAALGSVICLLSMLVKSSTASIIVCLGYVLFSETLVSVIKNLSSFSDTAARLVEWSVRHSIYSMSSIVSGASVSIDLAITILINSLAMGARSLYKKGNL